MFIFYRGLLWIIQDDWMSHTAFHSICQEVGFCLCIKAVQLAFSKFWDFVFMMKMFHFVHAPVIRSQQDKCSHTNHSFIPIYYKPLTAVTWDKSRDVSWIVSFTALCQKLIEIMARCAPAIHVLACFYHGGWLSRGPSRKRSLCTAHWMLIETLNESSKNENKRIL